MDDAIEMDRPTQHIIEPELLAPAPRRTQPRSQRLYVVMVLYRFAMALLLVGGILLLLFFCLQIVLGTSRPVEGKVTGIRHPTQASGGSATMPAVAIEARNNMSPPLPTLQYTFVVNGVAIDGTARITEEQIRLLPDRGLVQVRYLAWLPEIGNRPILPGDTFWRGLAMLGLITLLSEAVIATLCWFAFVVPKRECRLCRSGIAAVGFVTRRETLISVVTQYIVQYRFEPVPLVPADRNKARAEARREAEIVGQMRVPKEFWERVDAGDPVTVLYDAARPATSILYTPSLYEAEEPAVAVVRVRTNRNDTADRPR